MTITISDLLSHSRTIDATPDQSGSPVQEYAFFVEFGRFDAESTGTLVDQIRVMVVRNKVYTYRRPFGRRSSTWKQISAPTPDEAFTEAMAFINNVVFSDSEESREVFLIGVPLLVQLTTSNVLELEDDSSAPLVRYVAAAAIEDGYFKLTDAVNLSSMRDIAASAAV